MSGSHRGGRSGGALEAGGNLDTIAGDTTSLDSKITTCNTSAVVVSSGTITETNSGTIATDTTSIDGKIPILGQAAPASSVPVVDATATVTTAINGLVMDQDRISAAIDKSGRNHVAVSIVTTMGGGGPFNAVGVIKILGNTTDTLTTADVLALPLLNITAAGTFKLEFECFFPYIEIWYDRTSDGDDDPITVSVAVS